QASNHSVGQASNHSVGQASNHSSASSGQLTFTGISLTVWNQFKQIFDHIMTENNYMEEMCLSVAMDIRSLGVNIKKATVQGFYERNIKKKNDLSRVQRGLRAEDPLPDG
ncbi:10275_t:CDS:2, partial [Acaulospora morrowiae]